VGFKIALPHPEYYIDWINNIFIINGLLKKTSNGSPELIEGRPLHKSRILMNDPAASGRGIRQRFPFKCHGKPRGIKPTGGNKVYPKLPNTSSRAAKSGAATQSLWIASSLMLLAKTGYEKVSIEGGQEAIK